MENRDKILKEFASLLVEFSFESCFVRMFLDLSQIREKNLEDVRESERHFVRFFQAVSDRQVLQLEYIYYRLAEESIKNFIKLMKEIQDRYRIIYQGEDFDLHIDLSERLDDLQKLLFDDDSFIEKHIKYKEEYKKIKELAKQYAKKG